MEYLLADYTPRISWDYKTLEIINKATGAIAPFDLEAQDWQVRTDATNTTFYVESPNFTPTLDYPVQVNPPKGTIYFYNGASVIVITDVRLPATNNYAVFTIDQQAAILRYTNNVFVVRTLAKQAGSPIPCDSCAKMYVIDSVDSAN